MSLNIRRSLENPQLMWDVANRQWCSLTFEGWSEGKKGKSWMFPAGLPGALGR